MVSKGEIDFFKSIKEDCNVIFDVGCRTDIPYIELCPEAQFHLFEPNEVSFKELEKKVNKDSLNIHLNNFGIGDKTGITPYYVNTESMTKRTLGVYSDPSTMKYCTVKKLTEYLEENNILNIDFFKIDTEGYEPEILYDNIAFIATKVKYLQFEYGSTWLDKYNIVSIYDVYKTYSDLFNFFYVYDENHPMCQENKETLTPITYDSLELIENYIRKFCGYNIAMVRK